LKERKLLLAKGNVCGLFELVPCCTKLLEKWVFGLLFPTPYPSGRLQKKFQNILFLKSDHRQTTYQKRSFLFRRKQKIKMCRKHKTFQQMLCTVYLRYRRILLEHLQHLKYTFKINLKMTINWRVWQ
jgi:hypothetical protein